MARIVGIGSWRGSRILDNAVDMVVYQGATHGEHEACLSALLVTKSCEVFGIGLNTLVTKSDFDNEYPMLEAGPPLLPTWVKIEKLSEIGARKIVVGFGWGAALTKADGLVLWGKGAPNYLGQEGIEIVELYDTEKRCTTCTEPCADYGRRIGNTFFSYCKIQQKLVTYSELDIPEGTKVKRLGNRKYGALVCGQCSKECSMEVMESHTFNFCNNCNHLWDLDENALAMEVETKPMRSFLQKLDYQGRIADIAPCQFGFWVLMGHKRLAYSGFFVPTDSSIQLPTWWKTPLVVPKIIRQAESIHTNKIDVFVLTDSGILFVRRRVEKEGRRPSADYSTFRLRRVQLDSGVKKIFCGRHASLCCLEDGSLNILWSYSNGELADPDGQAAVKNVDRPLDITGMWGADIFYVQLTRYRETFRKRHPENGSMVEVIFGLMDCKAFLSEFSKSGMVGSDGAISYDEEAIARHAEEKSLVGSRDPSPSETPDAAALQTMETAAAAATSIDGEPERELREVRSTGLGLPVGTSWSRAAAVAAVAGQYVATKVGRLYAAVKSGWQSSGGQIWKKTHKLGSRLSTNWNASPPVTLPPFQAGLYGKATFSDIVILMADGKIPAHRIILCSTSKFFRDKLSGTKFDAKYFDAKKENPRSYRCLLEYFYQRKPDDLDWKDTLDLLILASRYNERRIAEEVGDKLVTMLDANNVDTILEVATRNELANVVMNCEQFKKIDPTYKPTSSTNEAASRPSTIEK